jgi:hypothetical protein
MASFDEDGRLKVKVEGGATVINNIYTSVTTSQNVLDVKNNGITLSPTTYQIDFSNSFILTSSVADQVKVSASFGTNIKPTNTSSFAGTSSLFAREDHVHQDSTAASLVGYPFEIYQTSSQFVSNSPNFSTIEFQSTRISNAIYTVNSNRNAITFVSGGTYQIQYRVSIDNTVNQRSQGLAALTINNNPVLGSYGYETSVASSQGAITIPGFVFLTVSSNDVLRVIAQRQTGGGNLITVNSGTNILITRWA